MNTYEFKDPIHPQLRKVSKELYVLYMLQHFFPKKYEHLSKNEKPDLLDKQNSLGVEVTEATDASYEAMGNKYMLFKETEDLQKKSELKNIILQNNGKILELKHNTRFIYSLSFPITTSDSEAELIKQCIIKKSGKLSAYLNTVHHIELAVITEIPYKEEFSNYWKAQLNEIHKNSSTHFEFYYLFYPNMIWLYDSVSRRIEIKQISKELRLTLQHKARKIAEDDFIK